MTFPIIALTGPTGSGKDSIGQYLIDRHHYTRVAFGDALRRDVCQEYKIEQPTDERKSQFSLGKLNKHPYFSFKDLMVAHGRKIAIEDPTRYVRRLCKILSTANRPIVITDVRRPLELFALQSLSNYAVWGFKVIRDMNPHDPKAFDNLLDGYNLTEIHNHQSPDNPALSISWAVSEIQDHMIRTLPMNYESLKF